MNDGNDVLIKVLKTEAARGFDNQTVIGGIHKITTHWKEKAQDHGLEKQITQLVASKLKEYSGATKSDRKNIHEELLSILSKQYETINDVAKIEDSSQVIDNTENTQDKQQWDLDTYLTEIPGIGPKNAAKLKKMGMSTVKDAIYHFPHRYIDYSTLKPISQIKYQDVVTIVGTIQQVNQRKTRGGKLSIIEIKIADSTGTIICTWFNQPWLQKQLYPGKEVQISGTVDVYLGKKTISNPEWELFDKKSIHTGRIVPVYHLTKGINAKSMRRWIHTIVSKTTPFIKDPIPTSICKRLNLINMSESLYQVHFPDSQKQLQESQNRLAFYELFLLHVRMKFKKATQQNKMGQKLQSNPSWIKSLISCIPFSLTNAQARVTQEIISDITKTTPMSRLVQGDVGSGKTIVAAIALAVTANNNAQAALMAPTSILAEQHYKTITDLFKLFPMSTDNNDHTSNIRLLLGSTTESDRAEISKGLEDGSIKIVIGTHSLIQDTVEFSNLALTIIDEQHRFGVEQRDILRKKGKEPHLMVMTATPIPRSLALTLYGDLDLSIIDELPPGRQTVETKVISPIQRDKMYQFVNEQINQGRQAFFIYPLIEESDSLQVKAAVKEHENLQNNIFPTHNVGLLHGRMKSEDKYHQMNNFRNGDIDILVSTTVIEVGVDIPNASIMIIENANRFGLAQLHQLRGRVGRGNQKSYCLLVNEQTNNQLFDTDNSDNERLRIMESSNDGFVLAEKDLLMRGPGDFLGTRQSGFSFQLAKLSDMNLIQLTLTEAERLLENDPQLRMTENLLLANEVTKHIEANNRERR